MVPRNTRKLSSLFCSVSLLWIFYCKYWIPAPAGGPRLVYPPVLSGRQAGVSYTQRADSTCKSSGDTNEWDMLLPGGRGGLKACVAHSAHEDSGEKKSGLTRYEFEQDIPIQP